MDAGVRFPRGIFMINVADLGNYEQCLKLKSEIDDMQIQGKYYLISIPFDQELKLPFEIPTNFSLRDRNVVRVTNFYNEIQDFAVRTDAEE